MSQRRVCDGCAVRRVRCDGQTPCAGCISASLDCTRIRQKHKSGPKGIKKRTLEKLDRIKQPQATLQQLRPEDLRQLTDYMTSVDEFQSQPEHMGNDFSMPIPQSETSVLSCAGNEPQVVLPRWDAASWDVSTTYPYKINLDHLALYLDIYHHKLYPIWPIVNKSNLMARLNAAIPDTEAYILAASVCVATILQLQLTATDPTGSILQPDAIMQELHVLRQTQNYRENPSLDSLKTSFFLHVAYLHMKKQRTSTLTLRESISLAHMLDLHKATHYEALSGPEANEDLRVLWLLFITERAHSLQYDLPCTLAVPSDLPLPHADADAESFTLSAFISLCSMFKTLAKASTNNSQTALQLSYTHLLQLPDPTQPYNQLQKADVGVTQHWMKLHLWKLAVQSISMTSEPGGDITSVLFPLKVVRDLLSEVSALSVDSLEAHGSGMELKLFEFANTIADVMVCVPHQWTLDTRIGPREYLTHLGKVLGGFRGGNEALLPLLGSRFAELGLSLPSIPRLIDVTYESSDSSLARVTHMGDDHMPWLVDEATQEEADWTKALVSPTAG